MYSSEKEIRKLENKFSFVLRRIFNNGLTVRNTNNIKEDLLLNIKREINRENYQLQLANIIYDTAWLAKEDYYTILTASSKEEEERNKILLFYLSLLPYVSLYLENLSLDVIESVESRLKREYRSLRSISIPELNRKIQTTFNLFEIYQLNRYSTTFVNDVYNSAQHQVYRDYHVNKLFFSAIIDDRTSDICRMMNGTIFDTNSSEADYYRPPLHLNCRSRYVVIEEIVNTDLYYQNRDYSQLYDQYGMPTSEIFDEFVIHKNFVNIKTFREKWSIPQDILEKDLAYILNL